MSDDEKRGYENECSDDSYSSKISNEKGAIPIAIIIVLAIIAAFGAGMFIGDGLAFKIGIGIGVLLVFLLPNTAAIIRWFKDIRKAAKEKNE